MSERQLEHYRLRKIGFVFQFFNLIPSLSAIENLELPMLIAGMSEPRSAASRAETLLETVGLRAEGLQAAGGAVRRRAAARRGLPCARQRSRRSSSPTSRPAISTAPTPRSSPTCWSTSPNERGKTVIVASHDPKVVEAFPRVYHMRDGVIERAA